MHSLKSGELAKQAQVNPETLRYYEREGLLPEPTRTEAGYRLYHPDDVKRVRFIKKAQELGFSLKEVKELLALKLNADHSASEVKRLTEHKIRDIEAKIQSLQAMKKVLADLASACSGTGSVDYCPILNCLEENSQENGQENTQEKGGEHSCKVC
jgi:MerR family mercuric resistance operon transcriptional regulator